MLGYEQSGLQRVTPEEGSESSASRGKSPRGPALSLTDLEYEERVPKRKKDRPSRISHSPSKNLKYKHQAGRSVPCSPPALAAQGPRRSGAAGE